MKNIKDIKTGFYLHFTEQMKIEGFMGFFYELFMTGSAYVVGGYFRDFLLSKSSRDVDIITDLSQNQLISLVNNANVNFNINRHGGLKISLTQIEIDIWTIDNNWAFKNNLVKLNENDILNSIAKGCFYNFDSLAINLHTFNYSIRYFSECLNKKELNILQENSIYKNLNPSIEANILRAIYLGKIYNLKYSPNTINYLFSKIGFIADKFNNPLERILTVREQYPKYSIIKENDILNLFFNLLEGQDSKQLKLDL
ncbi:hypothetical protein GCM10023210_27490 [Chryseobacterium ginsengisoli]|uniref:Poly A polymerase head domain-containing protein n=2 Tax=Chryseobacterium ginsengisoli TaxID=363853 RepID=A0ABP9MFY4_9FLAO